MISMTARGPDGSGFFTAPGVAFGHTRLSIIDVQGGCQPMTDEPTGVTLVYNGEIFNFKELKRTLLGLGHPFKTESDTEVLLHAYLEWGTKCLDRLVGMYAFAVYDPARRRLLLARDRLGVKPLFFHVAPDGIVFASSCTALRHFPGIGPEMHPAAVSHYLTTIRTTLGRQTMLRDIQSLLPGEFLLAEHGIPVPTIERYWDLPAIAPDDKEQPGLDRAAGRACELISDSLTGQLVSDVPLGGFLSGGIDSSILAALACRANPGNFNAYSVGYDKDGYNEWPFVRRAAAFHNMRCREIHLDEQEFPRTWRELVRAKGLPVSTPNEIAIRHLAGAVKEDFTVALSGEGADEIFGGYVTPFFSAFDYERARRSPPEPGSRLSALDLSLRSIYRRPYLLCRPDHYFLVNSWIPFDQKRALLTRDAWESLDGDSALFDHYENWFDRFSNCSTFDAYMQIHARINMEGLLARVDSSTMAASVEARVPFTDHRIAEYLFSLPDNYKIDWKDEQARETGKHLNIAQIDRQHLLTSKILLRRAFDSHVPTEIMERPKVSFPVPFLEWFANGMRPLLREVLEQSPLVGTLFDTAAVNALLATPEQTRSAMALWPLMNLCLWQQECGTRPATLRGHT